MSRGGKRPGAGRPFASRTRKAATVRLFNEDWQYLKDKGQSYSRSIENLIKKERKDAT